MVHYKLRRIWNPGWFQGDLKNKQYFEGWYYKLVNADTSRILAVIPGISLGKEENYPFIQLINGRTGNTHFIQYSMSDVQFARDDFRISIDDNHFYSNGLKLDIRRGELAFSGELEFKNMVVYPVTTLSPGVMGWYRFVPTMECYHGILSMNHSISGSLEISGKTVDFTGGKGYLEKDWGKSMPIAWIWIQSNHFQRQDMSVSFSIANIPWKKSAFTGFLIIVSIGDRFYRFTTYNRSRIIKLLEKDGTVVFEVENRHYRLSVEAISEKTGNLMAPVEGVMERTIHESIGAKVNLKLMHRDGSIIIEDSGDPAGMEIAGEMKILQKDFHS
jgi:hypothetical protein